VADHARDPHLPCASQREICGDATHLKLDYSLVKRVVRALVGWRILERTVDGLHFQPDAGRWKAPGSRPNVAGNSRGVPGRTLRVGLMAERASELQT
jgi:hypothetical protein